MNAAAIKADLERHSRATGIPVPELRRICLRAGLDLLERGELKVRDPRAELPIFLPADDVRFLRELCEAADIEGGADQFADAVLGAAIRESLKSTPQLLVGVPEMICAGWVYDEPGEKERAEAATQAVVDCWKAKERFEHE